MPRLTRRTNVLLLALVLFALTAAPAHAVNKDMIQLQAQVQQLQDALGRLQQTTDQNFGMLQSLIQQTADSVNKMSTAVSGLQLSMQNSQAAMTTAGNTTAGQVQALNDSIDELKARMQRMEKTLTDMQSQQQSIAGALSNLPQASGSAPGATATPAPAPSTSPTGISNTPVDGPPQGAPLPAGGDQVASAVPTPSGGPSSGDLYRAAYGDYISAHYALAGSEFQQLIQAYPNDNLSGNAYYYEGEMDMRTGKPTAAIRAYDHLLEQYPDNAKIPAAHLHKAEALISTHETEAGVRELRALITRFPTSPEAAQARSKLNGMGVPVYPRR